MQLVKEGTVIDFLGKRFYAGIFSAILLVGGVVSVSYTHLTLPTKA